MAKLSAAIKEKIIKELLNPLEIDISKIENNISKYLSNILKSGIPEEVLTCTNNYPEWFKLQNSFLVSLVDLGYDQKEYGFIKLYIDNQEAKLPYPYYWLNKEDLDIRGKQRELLTKLLNSLRDTLKEKNTINYKLSCVFGEIKTSKKLQEEYPEAFKIYVELTKNPVKNKINKCDAVEEVRAFLGKKANK